MIQGNPLCKGINMEENSILIVEDEMVVAQSIKHKLEKMGYAVYGICSNGSETLQLIDSAPPNLILMDIKLDGHPDGIETAKVISDRYDVPIVYITAYADEETLGRAKLTAPYGYVLKPFTDRELRSNIEIAFYKHKMEKELKKSEKHLRTIIQSMNTGLLVLDSEWNITFLNEQMTAMLGFQENELLGNPFRMLISEDAIETAEQLLGNGIIRSERSFEVTLKKKDNGLLPVLISPKFFLESSMVFQGGIFTIIDLSQFHLKSFNSPSNLSDVVAEEIEQNHYPALLLQPANWNVIDVNENFLELVDSKVDDVINHSFIQFANWKELDELNRFLFFVKCEQNLNRTPVTLRTKAGELRSVTARKKMIRRDGISLSVVAFKK